MLCFYDKDSKAAVEESHAAVGSVWNPMREQVPLAVEVFLLVSGRIQLRCTEAFAAVVSEFFSSFA